MKVEALIKFFREPTHLEALLGGTVYCNTPEYYRLNATPGVGDKHESCTFSYRQSRNDPKLTLSIGGIELEGVTEITGYRGPKKDMWLHCWTGFRIPADEEGLNHLIDDLNRMRSEFGPHYAVMPGANLRPFAERLRASTPNEITHGSVRYSDNRNEWSVVCKAEQFRYQREFRFAIGECNPKSPPLIIRYAAGFRDLIFGSHPLRLTDAETDRVWFQLDRDGCRSAAG